MIKPKVNILEQLSPLGLSCAAQFERSLYEFLTEGRKKPQDLSKCISLCVSSIHFTSPVSAHSRQSAILNLALILMWTLTVEKLVADGHSVLIGIFASNKFASNNSLVLDIKIN